MSPFMVIWVGQTARGEIIHGSHIVFAADHSEAAEMALSFAISEDARNELIVKVKMLAGAEYQQRMVN